MSAAATPPRPRLAFRIGVTGTRFIAPEAADALQPRLRDVLRLVKAEIDALSTQSHVRIAYDPAPPLLRLLSPLAEGADRLVADVALDLGYQLEAALPFPPDDYKNDFPASADAFDRLLARAEDRVIVLDGARGSDETRSYEAVGRLVVRNCDLIIAIWDGGPGRGRGGTADIVRFAARYGPPVWWLHADGGADAVWITDPRALRHGELAIRGVEADTALLTYITDTIVPPGPATEHAHGVIGQATSCLRRARGHETEPLQAFLAERTLPKRWFWSLYERLIRWAGRAPPRSDWAPPPAVPGASWAYWESFYALPNELAISYAERYRSSYVMVFGAAALAVACSVIGVAHGNLLFTLAELIWLTLILVLVVANEFGRWRDRLITYRLLAELCRKQQALALVDWSLPVAEVTRVAAGTGAAEAREREAWVGWYFNAALRAAPLAKLPLSVAERQATRDVLVQNLVEGQADYHARRGQTYRIAARYFGVRGEVLFLLTGLIVVLELWFHGAGDIPFGLVAALLPAFSAALVGIRSYAELEIMAEQSERMKSVVRRAKTRLEAQPLAGALVSQELGEEVFALADAMLRDVTGWTQLYRVKAVETG